MTDRDASTSLQRTYRYLRLAIAGAVVVVFAAILVTMPRVGLLPSISHYYYTPANTMFVGALMAVAVSFFALSGRGAERVLLDVAAAVVPLVAIVPTQISPGSVPGIDSTCPGGAGSCVPKSFDAAVDTGILTYLIVGFVVLLVATALAVFGEVDRAGALLSIGIGGVILLVVWLAWWLGEDAFLSWAHLVAAVGFFGIIAAVAVINAIAPTGREAPRWLKGAYIAIASALVLVVVGMPLYGSLHVGAVFGVFVGEVLALVLFAVFWILQSIQYWRVDDPAIIARV
jgi:hypothetical protein